uniref:Cysteine-rich motor neuron 1 protein n=1 Tax=Heterorhabditis bacteriophora TaxID=37862 RepID=A0A1I7XIT9_HETBA
MDRCRCRAAVCRPAVCPEGKKLKIIRKGNGNPGKCCDEWECEDDPQSLTPGRCTWIVIPDGECCPICVGCQTERLEKKKKHEIWQKDDCTTCTCSEEGTHVCEKHMCRTECENSRKVNGQCCPVCDEPVVLTLPATCPSLEHCPLRCENGLRRDDRGCFECECLPVEHPSGSDCPQISKQNCDKLVISSFYNIILDYFELHFLKEFCSLISCPTRPKDCNENDWQQKEGSCCPTCVTSVLDTTLPTSKHEHTVCQSPGTGRLFTDGETWQLAPCVSCTCRVGHVLCRTVECPPIACKDPVMAPDDQCCPKCLSNTVHNDKFNSETTSICTDEAGIAHVLGSPWRTDDCTSCTCTNVGKIECYRESCEPSEECVGSPLIIKGRCCPVCSDVLSSADVCSYKSSVYSVNEEWMDGYCTNCSCVTGGHTVCREMVCPQCADPVPIEGHCCPLCKDIGWTAFSESNGSVLVPPRGGWAPLPIIGFLLMSFAIFGLLVVLFILYKRSRNNSKVSRKSFDKASSSVRLSASKQIGSMPQLVDWPGRRDSHSDGQSESLLSTASDTSTAISSVSSGNSPHNDTQPLTGRRNLPHNKLFQCNV